MLTLPQKQIWKHLYGCHAHLEIGKVPNLHLHLVRWNLIAKISTQPYPLTRL
ncbi:hypothetical protein [Aeromonas phage Akh-2]|nr:hypothetical protein [Aeromonas phage Akh-2]